MARLLALYLHSYKGSRIGNNMPRRNIMQRLKNLNT